MLVFFGGFILAAKPFDYDPSMWGWLLFLFAISAAALATWFQYKYGSIQLEMQLKLMEHEFRDAELTLSAEEQRQMQSVWLKQAGSGPIGDLEQPPSDSTSLRSASSSSLVKSSTMVWQSKTSVLDWQNARTARDNQLLASLQPPRSLSQRIRDRTRKGGNALFKQLKPKKVIRNEYVQRRLDASPCPLSLWLLLSSCCLLD